MPMTVRFVKKARKTYPEFGVRRGDSYYWWKFRGEARQMSRFYPPRSWLTKSERLARLYAAEDSLPDVIETDADILPAVLQLVKVARTLDEIAAAYELGAERTPEKLQYSSHADGLRERARGIRKTQRVVAGAVLGLRDLNQKLLAVPDAVEETLAAANNLLDGIDFSHCHEGVSRPYPKNHPDRLRYHDEP